MSGRSAIESAQVVGFVTSLLSPGMHRKRAFSIGQAVLGVMHAGRLGSAAVGRALAAQVGITPKCGIKQVDRLLGNEKFDIASAVELTVPWLVAGREQIVVSLDWTEYGLHGHSRIALNLVTAHGRATPLVWKTVLTKRLKGRQTGFEDELLNLLANTLPSDVKVLLLADRGFADVKLYNHLRENLGWDFIIRFRAKTHVESASGELRMAGEWVPAGGRLRELPDALVTAQRVPVNVVCVKRRGMKDSWCLATSLQGEGARAVALYGRRFTCEETFRDEKDPRFGLGFRQTVASTTERRDRFLFISMLATFLLTLLGGAGEQIGCDRALKANTSPRRSHSLFRQGREYLAGRVGKRLDALRAAFLALLRGHDQETRVYALI
jgi:hypothetical protein